MIMNSMQMYKAYINMNMLNQNVQHYQNQAAAALYLSVIIVRQWKAIVSCKLRLFK